MLSLVFGRLSLSHAMTVCVGNGKYSVCWMLPSKREVGWLKLSGTEARRQTRRARRTS